MRIAGYHVDWKDAFEGKIVNEMLEAVGGLRLVYNYDVSMYVDVQLQIYSDSYLSLAQLDHLWDVGDLTIGDGEVLEGTFEEILVELKVRVEERE